MVGQHWLKMKEKIGPHACLRVNNHSFFWWAKPHNNKPIMPCMYMHCEHPLMTEQNVVEACVMEYMRMLKKDVCSACVAVYKITVAPLLYYWQFTRSERNWNFNKFYLYNMGTSIIWTPGSVPLVSVLT